VEVYKHVSASNKIIEGQCECGKGSVKQMLSVTKLNLPESTYSDMPVVDISDHPGMLGQGRAGQMAPCTHSVKDRGKHCKPVHYLPLVLVHKQPAPNKINIHTVIMI
jgi:hypothetical protein